MVPRAYSISLALLLLGAFVAAHLHEAVTPPAADSYDQEGGALVESDDESPLEDESPAEDGGKYGQNSTDDAIAMQSRAQSKVSVQRWCKCQKKTKGRANVGNPCANVLEGRTASLTCPAGSKIHGFAFASFGRPSGHCGKYKKSWCHSHLSFNAAWRHCDKRRYCRVKASKSLFGDPCKGQRKRLILQARCNLNYRTALVDGVNMTIDEDEETQIAEMIEDMNFALAAEENITALEEADLDSSDGSGMQTVVYIIAGAALVLLIGLLFLYYRKGKRNTSHSRGHDSHGKQAGRSSNRHSSPRPTRLESPRTRELSTGSRQHSPRPHEPSPRWRDLSAAEDSTRPRPPSVNPRSGSSAEFVPPSPSHAR